MIRFNKPTIEKKDLESVLYCMIGDDLMPGDHLKSFTRMLSQQLGLSSVGVFSNYCGCFETVFSLIDAGPGDEVIIPSYARFRIYHCIVKSGLKPVPVDLEEDALLPSVDDITHKRTDRTKCIVIPQMFGIPGDLEPYLELGLPVIEDLDGSLDSRIGEKRIGSFGNFVTMHFHDDSIITTGAGGMVASRDRRLGVYLRTLREEETCCDYLMSDFNASLGLSQMKKLGKTLEKRRSIGRFFDEAVMGSSCTLPGVRQDLDLDYSSYPVMTDTPFEDCVRFFKKYDIPVRRGIRNPLHRIAGLDGTDFKHTEETDRRMVALPVYPTLSGEHVNNIAKGIRAVL